jgi:hypothetical protein
MAALLITITVAVVAVWGLAKIAMAAEAMDYASATRICLAAAFLVGGCYSVYTGLANMASGHVASFITVLIGVAVLVVGCSLVSAEEKEEE